MTGSVADHAVDVEVRAADGGLGGHDAVSIEGTFADVRLELFADVAPGRKLSAIVRGTCNGTAVHVDMTRPRRSEPLHVTGRYHGPVELVTVLLAALLSFDR